MRSFSVRRPEKRNENKLLFPPNGRKPAETTVPIGACNLKIINSLRWLIGSRFFGKCTKIIHMDKMVLANSKDAV